MRGGRLPGHGLSWSVSYLPESYSLSVRPFGLPARTGFRATASHSAPLPTGWRIRDRLSAIPSLNVYRSLGYLWLSSYARVFTEKA